MRKFGCRFVEDDGLARSHVKDHNRFRRWIVLAAVNLAIACGVVLLLEAVGQAAFFFRHGRSLLAGGTSTASHQELFEPHPFLVGRPRRDVTVAAGDVVITTTEHYTRWTGSSANEADCVRIAIFGGSTAFGTRVSDKDTWPAVVQRELGDGYCVRNYGVPGYSSAEAIIQLALIVPDFMPDILVFLQGWNDIKHYHEPGFTPDYFSHGVQQATNLGLRREQGAEIRAAIKRRSALVRAAAAIRFRLGLSPPSDRPAGLSSSDPVVDRAYVRNLGTLVALSERFGARAVFVPQVLNEAYFNTTPGSDDWTPHASNASMIELMERFNRLTQAECESHHELCAFVDEVLGAPWEPVDFVDAGHFSRTGGLKFAAIVSEAIRREVENAPLEGSEPK